MNTLKNVLFFGLLLAVLCLVYVSLTRTQNAPLPEGLSGDTRPPDVQLGQALPPLTSIPNGTPSNPPGLPSQPPPLNVPPTGDNSLAPPFQSPPTGSPLPTTLPANAAPPWSPGGGSAALAPPTPAVPPPTPVRNYPPGISDPFIAGGGSASSPAASPLGALPPPPADHSASIKIDEILQKVDSDVEKNRMAEALELLSQLYDNPDLPASRAREVTMRLDWMAAKVIYSREHWSAKDSYLVQTGDTLDAISERYQVPALVLARINGIRDPQNLPPGKELKVVKGPFRAQINTDRKELTLWLADSYAGRFSVVLSNDLSHAANLLTTVRDKRAASAAPGNGVGKQWIELSNAGGNINMQGTNDTQVAAGRDNHNTIWLSEQDMDDVFGILSVGSRVIIQR